MTGAVSDWNLVRTVHHEFSKIKRFKRLIIRFVGDNPGFAELGIIQQFFSRLSLGNFQKTGLNSLLDVSRDSGMCCEGVWMESFCLHQNAQLRFQFLWLCIICALNATASNLMSPRTTER